MIRAVLAGNILQEAEKQWAWWHIRGHVSPDYGSSISESRSCDRPAFGTLPAFPRELLMGLHTFEDRLLCLGDVIIKDTSLIISKDPAPRVGSHLQHKVSSMLEDGSKVEFVAVTLLWRSHLKNCHPIWLTNTTDRRKNVLGQRNERAKLSFLGLPLVELHDIDWESPRNYIYSTQFERFEFKYQLHESNGVTQEHTCVLRLKEL